MNERDALPPGRDGDPNALEVLLDLALRGDREATEALFTLLRTRHFSKIIGNLRQLGTRAHTQTLEDVFQESLMELFEKIRSGGLADLSPEDRRDVLGILQKICDRRLKNAVKRRKSPVFDRDKSEVPETFPDEKAPIPGDERKTEEHRRLLESAIHRLDPATRQILLRHLEGIPYSQIARETGRSEGALQVLICHAKQAILVDIFPQSPTARLNYEKERAMALKPPTAEEVRLVVDRLPRETGEAVRYIHYEGGSFESLVARLGDRGIEKARARLRKGYEILSARLRGAPFPETFKDLGLS